MARKLKFTVSSAVMGTVDVPGVVDDIETVVTVPALVVELKSSCGAMHPTLRIRHDLADAREELVPGAEVEMSLKVVK